MRWPEELQPVAMQRVAVVASRARLRDTLVLLADSGLVDLERRHPREGTTNAGETRDASDPTTQATAMVLSRAPELDVLERAGRIDLLAGELALRDTAAQAVEHRGAAILVGWMPAAQVDALAGRLAPVGTSLVALPSPARSEAPTLMAGPAVARVARPLVETYGTVPYADVDPSIFAGIAYVVMFGIMFGDVGHGLILAALGLYLRTARQPLLAPLRRAWPIVAGAGVAAAVCGVLYGELFGPTGLVPALWLEPREEPSVALAAGVGVGLVLLSLAWLLGMVNRWREGGASALLYAGSGIAGGALYVGGLLVALGTLIGAGAVQIAGAIVALGGLGLLFAGFLAAGGGGPAGLTEAIVESFDAIIRTASNAVSFVRLAAFGLTHAIVGGVVWSAAIGIAAMGGGWVVAAAAVFVVGNAVAFGLEALVAGLQALRLEYYELFSRVFTREGRPFAPWHVPVLIEEEA